MLLLGLIRITVTPEVNAIGVGVMLITLITFACAAVVATVRGSIGVRSTPQAHGCRRMSTTAEQRRPPAIALEQLERHYGELTAVAGIDLAIADGEFFSLIGPSGCGKTTTLRIVAGPRDPEQRQGLGARPGRDRRPRLQAAGQHGLPALRAVPAPERVRERRLRAAERKVSRGETRRRVPEMLELVGLTGREKARPKQLSGGQQQRVALARSLVLEPEVLLLDEPLGALDLKLRKQMQMVLKQIQREVGITFVYVTHDQEEAFSMSDRVAIMNRGKIEQIGDPVEIYAGRRRCSSPTSSAPRTASRHESSSGSGAAHTAPTWARSERSTCPASRGSRWATRRWPSSAPRRFAPTPGFGDAVLDGTVTDVSFMGPPDPVCGRRGRARYRRHAVSRR